MAAVVISGSVIYSLLWTEAGEKIRLLGEKSRQFRLRWYRLEIFALLGGFEKLNISEDYRG